MLFKDFGNSMNPHQSKLIKTLKKEIEKLGGNVVGISVVINIKELNNDELFSILDVNEE